jgi:hypothetical protein
MSPKAPIALCDRDSGGALSGNARQLHRVLNAPKTNSASSARFRNVRSVRNSSAIEANSRK